VDDWHFRLGHLFKDKLYVLSTKFDYISSKTCNYFCQICPLAKQKRISFHVSISSSNKIFYLLHMDVWGPLVITSVYEHRYFLLLWMISLGILGFFFWKLNQKYKVALNLSLLWLKLNFLLLWNALSNQGLNLICVSFTLPKV